MGKLKQGLENASLRTGNTIATPLRRGGEIANAVANIPRQGISGTKNMAEVKKQTRDALVHNFLNFSKVEGKWYQKMLKVPTNLVSAVTRRPVMIAGAGIASGLNQGIREPFKKLLYTPGKMFKGIGNATRIFSKKKGFDFAQYDTHETGGDTRVNKIREKSFGFFGVKGGSAGEKPAEEKKESKPKEEKKPESKPAPKVEEKKEEKKPEEKKIEEKKDKPEPKSETPASKPSDTPPKNIDDVKKKDKEETEKKEADEKEKKFPKWSSLDDKYKEKYRKDYLTLLENKPTKEGVIARGKKAKMGDTTEDILKNFKEKDPTFVEYVEAEILNKAA